MSETLFLHIGIEPWQWLYRGRDGQLGDRGRGVPPRAADEQVILVSQADCLPLVAELPPISGTRLAQALPYALEDQIAGSIEDQHVVSAGRDETGRMRALVVDRRQLEEWLAVLDDAGVQPSSLVPDALCLPGADNRLALLPLGERILVRRGDWQAAALEPDLLDDLLADWTGGIEAIDYHGDNPPAGLGQHAPELIRHPGGLEALTTPDAARPVSLLTGDYAPVRARRHRRVWGWAAAAAATAIALQFAFAGIEYFQLANRSERLGTEIESTFRAAFPGINRVVDPRAQAEQQLARLRFGQAAGFLNLLGRAGPVIRADDQMRVQAIDFRDGALEVRLSAPGVGALDTLEQRLQAVDLDASVQSASLGPEGADGRVVIRGGGA